MTITDYLALSQRVLADTAAHRPAMLAVDAAITVIVRALGDGHPMLVCGNGGSAADALHITGELVGRFRLERQALNCICLSSTPSVLTALGNDYAFDVVFARQVEAYGAPGGVLVGLSTSGRSPNVIKAFEAARARGMATIALTGEGGGPLAAVTDILIDVPSTVTPLIQQAHLCLYHHLCEQVEARLAPARGIVAAE